MVGMELNESEARRLVASLTARGVSARVEGVGVHWRVDVAAVEGRSVCVTCYWYEREEYGFVLGMNSANARSRLCNTSSDPYEGPEFDVTLEAGGTRIADGRTFVIEEVIACVRTWLSGASLNAVEQETPFVNQRQRAMRAVGERLDPRLRWEVVNDLTVELWAYGERRACRVSGKSCSFLVGQAQIGFAPSADDLPGDVASWLLEGVPPAVLANRGVELERHADVLEVDPARWHWLHVRDRIANPHDVLAPLARLITILATSPIASRFYTFSSLNRLCFSASSHYPWVGEYPAVWTDDDGEYWLDDVRYSLEDAVAGIEASLSGSPIEPFFGSAPDFEIRLVAESVSRLGSPVEPEIVRRGMWSDVWLIRRPRRCRMGGRILDCYAEGKSFCLRCGTRDEAVDLALRFLDGSVTLDDLEADNRMVPPFTFGWP
jgi:hypothetical protein